MKAIDQDEQPPRNGARRKPDAASHRMISSGDLERLYSLNLPRKLMELSELWNRELMKRSLARGHAGLKMSFATVMAYAGFPNARLTDIAARNGLTKQAISQIAREIASLGYIRLTPDPDDARARNIVLTERGRLLIAESLAEIEEFHTEMVALIGAEKMATLETIITELCEKVQARREDQKPDEG